MFFTCMRVAGRTVPGAASYKSFSLAQCLINRFLVHSKHVHARSSVYQPPASCQCGVDCSSSSYWCEVADSVACRHTLRLFRINSMDQRSRCKHHTRMSGHSHRLGVCVCLLNTEKFKAHALMNVTRAISSVYATNGGHCATLLASE